MRQRRENENLIKECVCLDMRSDGMRGHVEFPSVGEYQDLVSAVAKDVDGRFQHGGVKHCPKIFIKKRLGTKVAKEY